MPDPMPEIKYVEVPLKLKFFETTSLSNYDFNMETGECTVKEEPIGKPIKRGSVRIIVPLVETKDKKWVQAMGNDGTCGFISTDKIDIAPKYFEQENVKTLPPYRITLREDARKEKGIDIFIDRLRQLDHECSYNKKTGVIETTISRCVYAQFYSSIIHNLTIEAESEYPYAKNIVAQSLNNNYDKEEAKYGNRICAEARCKYRKDFYKKALVENEFRADEVPVKSQLDDINITIVCETSHGTSETRDWMADQLDEGGFLQNADRIFVEDFLEGESQEIIDDYMLSSSSDLPPILKSFCDRPSHKGFEKLLTTAKEKNIKIIAIGSELSQTDTISDDNERKVERAAKFNQRAKEIIRNNPPATGKSAIIYAGRAHVQMHFSNTRGNVIQGFCKMFNTDAIMVKENDIELLSRDSVRDRSQKNVSIEEYIAEERPRSTRIEVPYEDFSKSGLSTKATKMSEPIAKKPENSTEVSKQPK